MTDRDYESRPSWSGMLSENQWARACARRMAAIAPELDARYGPGRWSVSFRRDTDDGWPDRYDVRVRDGADWEERGAGGGRPAWRTRNGSSTAC